MANLNKVMLIGRLTRDPEPIPNRAGGSAGAKFGFAVNNRKLNQDTQTWEDVPVFIDMEIWNRGESKQADRLLQTLKKGQQVFIEGHLKYDTWTEAPDKGGAKRSALRVVVETFQYLEPRQDGMGDAPPRAARPATAAAGRTSGGPPRNNGNYTGYEDAEPGMGAPPQRGGGAVGSEDDIPF